MYPDSQTFFVESWDFSTAFRHTSYQFRTYTFLEYKVDVKRWINTPLASRFVEISCSKSHLFFWSVF